jgi:hypothetical protein
MVTSQVVEAILHCMCLVAVGGVCVIQGFEERFCRHEVS